MHGCLNGAGALYEYQRQPEGNKRIASCKQHFLSFAFMLFVFVGIFFFPVSAHLRFANRFKSKRKSTSPGVYEFLHLQILNYPLHSSECVPGCMKHREDLAQVQRGNGCEWVFIFGSFNSYKVYLHSFEFIYICTKL